MLLTIATAQIVVFIRDWYAVAFSIGKEVLDSRRHLCGIKVCAATIIMDLPSVLVFMFYFEYMWCRILLHIDILGFILRATIAMSKICTDKMIITVLLPCPFRVISFQLHVVALLLHLVDVFQRSQVVACVI